MKIWKSQDAKSHFSEVIRKSKLSPQFISVRGKEEAVLISKETYETLTKPKMSLFELMQNSPFKGVNLAIERDKSLPREVNL